jgi:hypothetical protein
MGGADANAGSTSGTAVVKIRVNSGIELIGNARAVRASVDMAATIVDVGVKTRVKLVGDI